jgi:hypothetical protein
MMRLASAYPSIWTNLGAISLPRAIKLASSDISRFVWLDTIMAFVFGTPPLLYYDTPSQRKAQVEDRDLEWIHGCPEEFVVLIGRVNAWRSSFCIEQGLPFSNPWTEIEAEAKGWAPPACKPTKSWDSVVRLAVQESWRHSLLIYVYMVRVSEWRFLKDLTM